jgi:hypothetical protein
MTTRRKFYIVERRVTANPSGFDLANEDAQFEDRLPRIMSPPDGQRGFPDYPVAPLFVCDPRRAPVHWDFEVYLNYWFISERTKTLLENLDRDAFAFLRCDVRHPDGGDGPPRWLCDVVRVLDALDEQKSQVRIGTADDGSKFYGSAGRVNLVFKEDLVGPHPIFRMRHAESTVICDDRLVTACKAARIVGVRFALQRLRLRPKVDAQSRYREGNALRAAGKHDLAIAALSEAISLGAGERLLDDCFRCRADAHLQMGDFARAIADFDETIRLRRQQASAEAALVDSGVAVAEPRLAIAYQLRGQAYLKMGDQERASADFATARRFGLSDLQQDQTLRRS